MHAENIACFAAIVFLITIVYRKLMGAGWAAGLAALWIAIRISRWRSSPTAEG